MGRLVARLSLSPPARQKPPRLPALRPGHDSACLQVQAGPRSRRQRGGSWGREGPARSARPIAASGAARGASSPLLHTPHPPALAEAGACSARGPGGADREGGGHTTAPPGRRPPPRRRLESSGRAGARALRPSGGRRHHTPASGDPSGTSPRVGAWPAVGEQQPGTAHGRGGREAPIGGPPVGPAPLLPPPRPSASPSFPPTQTPSKHARAPGMYLDHGGDGTKEHTEGRGEREKIE